MKTKLLRKIRKDWEIIKAKNDDGQEVYRALYKGKWVSFAWEPASDPLNLQKLVLEIASREFIGASKKSFAKDSFMCEQYLRKRKTKREERLRRFRAERGEKVWYLQNK